MAIFFRGGPIFSTRNALHVHLQNCTRKKRVWYNVAKWTLNLCPCESKKFIWKSIRRPLSQCKALRNFATFCEIPCRCNMELLLHEVSQPSVLIISFQIWPSRADGVYERDGCKAEKGKIRPEARFFIVYPFFKRSKAKKGLLSTVLWKMIQMLKNVTRVLHTSRVTA